MIDLHSHILPELDDGAQSLEESLAMARMAVDSGVTDMVATPHCMGERSREVMDAYHFLREALWEANIPLNLHPGMEIFGSHAAARMLKEGKLLTLNGSRYPLVEFAFLSDGEEETVILRSLLRAGYRPVAAHTERYSYIQQMPQLINLWHKMGCLMQINRGSLLGRFGSRAQFSAMELVERGFAAVVASDAHSYVMRTPWMADAEELLAERISPLCQRTLLLDNPMKILRNEEVLPAEPEWFE